jgi:hypothetical protein
MDREPFLKWDVLTEEPPFDFLTLLQKSQFNSGLIRTFAELTRAQNLLVAELGRLLEPSLDFIRLAVANIETRRLTDNVLEGWKPVLANAINEWARQRTLTSVLESPAAIDGRGAETHESKIQTTAEELEALETIRARLGPDRPVAYEDTTAYFKIHLPDRTFWAICRLYLGRKKPSVWFPLAQDRVEPLAGGLPVSVPQIGWTAVGLSTTADLETLADLFRLAWEERRASRAGSDQPTGSEG